MTTTSKVKASEAFKGGPGLDGYAYRASIYCENCIQEIWKPEKDEYEWWEFQDSERVPQPIFFGESDYPQHCEECGEYLYGGNESEEW